MRKRQITPYRGDLTSPWAFTYLRARRTLAVKKRSPTRLALLEGFKREIESEIKESFPGQRFVVCLSPSYRDVVDVSVLTKMEVEGELKYVTWRDEYRTMNFDVTCHRKI